MRDVSIRARWACTLCGFLGEGNWFVSASLYCASRSVLAVPHAETLLPSARRIGHPCGGTARTGRGCATRAASAGKSTACAAPSARTFRGRTRTSPAAVLAVRPSCPQPWRRGENTLLPSCAMTRCSCAPRASAVPVAPPVFLRILFATIPRHLGALRVRLWMERTFTHTSTPRHMSYPYTLSPVPSPYIVPRCTP